MANIRRQFPTVFEGGSDKLHCDDYRRFNERWGWVGIAYKMAEKKIEEVERLYQKNLLDVLQLLSYLQEDALVDEKEDKFQERLRKARRK